jgi:hypothetical protein
LSSPGSSPCRWRGLSPRSSTPWRGWWVEIPKVDKMIPDDEPRSQYAALINRHRRVLSLRQLRHNTGNFTKIGPFGEKLSAETQQNQISHETFLSDSGG